MKRILPAFLCIALLCSLFVTNVSAEQDKKVRLLTDLGIIDKYEPDAAATRGMMMDFLDLLYGEGGHSRYFQDRERKQPVLYGQTLMILVDVTGYSAYLEVYGFDKEDNNSYLDAAIRAGITNSRIGDFTDSVKVRDFTDMVYNALCQTDLLSPNFTGSGQSYQIEKGKTLLNSVLELAYRDGVVTGTDGVSLMGFDGQRGSLAVDGKWYSFNFNEDAMQYLGLPVRIYFDEDTEQIKSVIVRDSLAKSVTVAAEDVIPDATGIRHIEYYEGTKRKTLDIDSEADFIYNRRILTAFNAEDLYLPDCTYRLIDNNGDSRIDVIIADKYTTFLVNTIVEHENRIIDDDSIVYDLTDYFDDGYLIYNRDRRVITLDDIVQNNVVSYQTSREGEYTGFVVSNQKLSGKIESTEEDWKKITVSGTEYECLEQYYSNKKNFETLHVGDEVMLYFDFKGYVSYIRRTSGTVKAGYVLGGYCNLELEDYALKILQEDGKIRTVKFSDNVLVNGERKRGLALADFSPLFKDRKAVQQLVLYQTSSKGLITKVDTAIDRSKIGANDNPGFTLDYDYSKESTLRAITLNGKTVLGSKYMPDENTIVFGVYADEEQLCYVQSGTAVPTASGLKVKLYNVDEDYVPEYVVIDSTASSGAWVDWWEKSYVVDKVREEYIEETEEVGYRIYYWDGDGNRMSAVVSDGELRPPNGNALSGDSRFRQVKLKDVPRGSVVQFNDNETGITSYSIQCMPMADNSEMIFEKASSVGGNDYGITEYMFNGSSICSYGRVIKRISNGIVINSHLPTAVEAASGGVFPMQSWNRAIPLTAGDVVLFYNKAGNTLEKGVASEILVGDMIFMHRRAGTVMTTIVYR